MTFKSLHLVLGALENQDSWRERQQFKRLLAHWSELVGPVVALQTRPLGIQRGVLNVSTSSAAWAQNLIFERHRLLEKVNSQFSVPLRDIRFSTAQWQTSRQKGNDSALEEEQSSPWQDHPSYLADKPAVTDNRKKRHFEIQPPQTPQAAFQSWAEAVRQRSQNLPLCPQCACPAPPGELKRWSVCALCAAKQM